MDAVDDFADVAHTGARCGVHFHHVDMAALGDGDAMFADTAGIGGRPAVSIRPDTVHALGNNPRGGGFAGPADAGHDERLRDPVGGKGVFQGAHHGLLADQIDKGRRTVFAGEYLIALVVGVGHGGLFTMLGAKVKRCHADVHRNHRARARRCHR